MTTGAVGSQGYAASGNVIDGVRTGVGRMTGLAVSTAAGTGRSVGNQRQILVTGMTGRTGIMLQVVSRIGEDRIINCGAMAILTGNRQVHTVGRIMIDVMGEQVQRRTVIDIAVALGTVAGDPAVLQRAVSVMTYRTGVML